MLLPQTQSNIDVKQEMKHMHTQTKPHIKTSIPTKHLHTPPTQEELHKAVIPLFILANTRTHRYAALLTAEWTSRKPSTGTATTIQFGQHLQQWGQGSEQQQLVPTPRLYVLWSPSLRPEPQFLLKRRLLPRWRCLSHTSTHCQFSNVTSKLPWLHKKPQVPMPGGQREV